MENQYVFLPYIYDLKVKNLIKDVEEIEEIEEEMTTEMTAEMIGEMEEETNKEETIGKEEDTTIMTTIPSTNTDFSERIIVFFKLIF